MSAKSSTARNTAFSSENTSCSMRRQRSRDSTRSIWKQQ
jgi:hypothetical protein